MTGTREALTSAGLEAQTRVHAQNRTLPNVFSAGNLAERLIWTRVVSHWPTVTKTPVCEETPFTLTTSNWSPGDNLGTVTFIWYTPGPEIPANATGAFI